MDILTSWINTHTKMIFLALFAQILLSESSPLDKETRGEGQQCANGWVHFERFCVTRARGASETAVALYCSGFRGIGVKGYCITKAHNLDKGTYDLPSDSSSKLSDALLKAVAFKGTGQTADSIVDTSESSDRTDELTSEHDISDEDAEEIACSKGWKQYGNLCVFVPMTVKEQCHLLNAVEFSGLCLKHADTEAIEKRGLKYRYSGKDKRVCCCAHVSARPNGYGCF